MSHSVQKKAADLRRGDVVVGDSGDAILVVLRAGAAPRPRYVRLLVWNALTERVAEEQLPEDWPARVEARDAVAPVTPSMTPEGAVVHLAARARVAGAL